MMKLELEKIDLIDFDKLEDTFVPIIINWYYLNNCKVNISSNVMRSLATSIINIVNKINWS
ncbi:MAG: hypothetical protein FWC47_00415 [Oscillospiraceae bacterium]|nr:hypothetical protein [Oscillospiraceae bacterium]